MVIIGILSVILVAVGVSILVSMHLENVRFEKKMERRRQRDADKQQAEGSKS